ncbi:MAG: putative C-S lyase, partial [Oceanospirillaceae bacterium]|nr:putative C-S lyase [Oceanospirillaceae bacterium]
NFDQLIDRTQSSSEKWQKYAGTDVLPMWVADTDFQSPPAVIEALTQRIEHGIFGYTETPDSLNAVFIERMQRMYSWSLATEQLIWLPGLVCGLNLAVRSTCSETGSAATATPIYPPFMSAPQLSQRGLVKVPMMRHGSHQIIDFDALQKNLTPETELLLFCNPHNPGGAVYRQAELERLAQIVIENNLVICSDEIHCDLILEPELKHIPVASLGPEIAARTITLMAPSKTWNIAGLGCSVAIIENPTLRAKFARVRKGLVPSVNLLGFTAAEAAYRDGDEWNRQQLTYLRANRDYLLREINALPGLKMDANEATYLAWIDASALGKESPQKFFEQAGVGLSDGKDFGDPQFVRLNFGCPRSRLEEAIRRMRAALC